MRPILAAFVVFSATTGHAEDSDRAKFSASELKNVWRDCDVSGRVRAAKVSCVNEQAEKLMRGKTIQRTNARTEAITRGQVGAPKE